jgi:CPA2 family monovalent cation:H+ antiporter-2
LLVTLQIAILLIAGGPLMAAVQPFYPSLPGAAVLLVLILLLAYPLWRSAANLQGHARAGAQAILQTVASQSQAGKPRAEQDVHTAPATMSLLPGLGSTALVTIDASSPALARSLRQIGLRGRTGATVIAIKRGDGKVVYPGADDVLGLGDVLVLTGTSESVELARQVLIASN